MRVWIFDIRKDGLYKLAPEGRPWKWDKIFPKEKKHNVQKIYENRAFDSWYDESLGMEVWNKDQLKDLERKGLSMMTHEEAKKIASGYRSKIYNETRERNRKQLRKSVVRIMRGETGINVAENDKHVPDYMVR